MQCDSCSAPVGANQKFCRNCGARAHEVAVTSVTQPQSASAACPSCGSPAALGARFCRRCGEALTPWPDQATAPRPAPRPELPREPVPPRRGVNWKLALGVGAILALIGGGSAAYVISNADKSDTTASPRTEASQRDSPAAAAPEQVSPQPSDDAVATTTTDVPTTTVGTTETRSTPPKETRATAPENTMRRHLQALVDQDYAAAFAEFSTGPTEAARRHGRRQPGSTTRRSRSGSSTRSHETRPVRRSR